MERLYCLLVTAFLLLSQLLVISCAFIIILDAVDIILCIHTIISQATTIVACALNIMLDAVVFIMYTYAYIISKWHCVLCFNHYSGCNWYYSVIIYRYIISNRHCVVPLCCFPVCVSCCYSKSSLYPSQRLLCFGLS